MNYFESQCVRENAMRITIVVLCIIAAVGPIITLLILQEEKKVLIMDQGGNFHLAPGSDMRDAKKLHFVCVKAAVTALLTRTPDGYLYKDLLFQSFTGNCNEYLRKYEEDTKNEFAVKNMRQIPEVKKINILEQGNGRYMAHVLVYLTRACQYQNITFVENAECTLSFLMCENPDISSNGRLPLVVLQVAKNDLKIKAK